MANRQTMHMIDQLQNKVSADGSFTLEKVLRAGSNAKHTSLRRTGENRFDVDLGAYYVGKGGPRRSWTRCWNSRVSDCSIFTTRRTKKTSRSSTAQSGFGS